jgi:5S rRNA maturation endonuclease (ribonuclease M5)
MNSNLGKLYNKPRPHSTFKKLTGNQIFSICDELADNLPKLLETLEIEYTEYPNRLAVKCPIHDGDNAEGACIYTTGDKQKGNWVCWTNSCHDNYNKNILGFIQGVMAKRKGEFSFPQVLSFAMKFLNKDFEAMEDVKSTKETILEATRFNEILTRSNETELPNISRETVIKNLDIPSKYFQDRGFKTEILKEFDVGDCFTAGKKMYGRAVVPVYDEDYNYVGCVGRTTNDAYHPKWINSDKFKKTLYLYGYHITKRYAQEKRAIFLVEGQGDVWKLYQAGIKNAAGIFGSNLGDDQLIILEKSGILDLVILTDNDTAGEKAAEQIQQKGGRRFNYIRPKFEAKDVGDMTEQEISEVIKPQTEGLYHE